MALRRKWPDGYPDPAATLQESLVIAVGVLHAIFDRNGGNGWSEDADGEHLDLIREHLLSFGGFTREEKDSVEWALTEMVLTELRQITQQQRGHWDEEGDPVGTANSGAAPLRA